MLNGRINMVSTLVGTFNKEKAQEGAFFGHSETLRRFIDSSILLADISLSTVGSWSIVLPHRCWLNVNDVGCCDTTLLTPCNWGLPRHRADLRAAGRPGPGGIYDTLAARRGNLFKSFF